MFAFVIGIICLVALIGTVRRHRYGYAHGFGGHHRGGRDWCGPPPPPRRDRWHHTHWGKREMIETLLDRIDATPEQEEVIRDQARAFHKKVKSLRGEGKRTREDLARAFSAESFDENIMGDLFVRHDDALRELRIQAVELLASVHIVLDERQRELLASIVASGRPFGIGGPYRTAW